MDNRMIEKTVRDDKKYVWHPFTQMADWVNDDPTEPLVIEKGRGNYLFDARGRKYLDGVSSLWVTLHGHRKSDIDNAVKRQLSKIAHTTFLGLTHAPAAALAKELVRVAPAGLKRVFYSDNGSTSVEIALKMSYQYWLQKGETKRTKFLSLANAYHGDTIGSVSVGGMEQFHEKFKPLLFQALRAPSPYCYRCGYNHSKIKGQKLKIKNFGEHCAVLGCRGQCLREIEQLLQRRNKEICAAVIEPLVQGAAGMLVQPAGYLKEFEKLCRKYGILLICDEVATGFGRTGRMFAVERENVRPDMMCLSKGITGGYLPLAATLTTEEIYRGFLGKYEDFKTFFHGHTYTANPLACAAALANLAVFNKEGTLKTLPAKEECLRKELSLLRELECVGDIRQKGLMVGIELVKNKALKEDFPAELKIGARVCAACRPKGLLIRPLGNVIVLMPPLSITEKEIKFMARSVREAVSEITRAKSSRAGPGSR